MKGKKKNEKMKGKMQNAAYNFTNFYQSDCFSARTE